jgi:penicillin-binding protein 1A
MERRYLMRKTDINRYAGPVMASGDKISTGNSIVRMLLKGLLTVFVILAVAGCIVMIAVAAFIFSLRNSSVDLDLQKLKLNYTSFIYVNGANDDQANPVKYQSLYSTENRVWIDADKIPSNMKNAIIAIEDKRFEDHNGVDWWRTVGAAASLFHIGGGQSGYGGSTITQQLIKNLTGEDQVSLTRKVTEIFRAINLEKKYSKEEILTAYLNVVNFGSGCNGVESAANTYFNKSIKDCDLAQCAAIAGITRNPTAYNPLLHPEANKKRQQTVLAAMHEQGKITDSEYQAALAESEHMQFYAKKKAAVIDENEIWNWYTDALFEDVKEGLMQAYNCSADHAVDLIYHGGLHIYSAMNQNLQTSAEKVFNDGSTFPSSSPNLQGGYVAMDYSGRVLAIVGGRGKKTVNRAYNLATDALRQPGSSIKPLAVYGPALNMGKINYSSLINDEPQPDYFGKGMPGPKNWDSDNTFHGEITVEYALEQSFNAAAIQVYNEITPKVGLDFMRQKLGFTSIENSDYNLASGIGGLTHGVTVREMTAGFQIFGNGGKFYKPYTYYYVTDHDGNVINGMDNRSESYTQAISSSAATIMNKLLAHVMKNGTGSAADISGWETFGKTGTTDNYKDLWFVGGTPYAVAGVWTGYSTPRTVEKGAARNVAKKIWKNIMKEYLSGKEKKTFQFDPNVVSAKFDKKTGLLAVPGLCTDTGTGWYEKNNLPDVCTETESSSSTVPESIVSSSAAESSQPSSSEMGQQTSSDSASDVTSSEQQRQEPPSESSSEETMSEPETVTREDDRGENNRGKPKGPEPGR